MDIFKFLLKKNLFSFIIMGLLLLVIIVSVLVFAFCFQSKSVVEGEIRTKLAFLKEIKMSKEGVPTSDWIDYLNEKNEKLEEIFGNIKGELNTPFSRMPDAYEIKEPLRFKEEIFGIQKELKEQVESNAIELKGDSRSFGFKEYETKIPQQREVPNLTKRLNIIKELAKLICANRVKSIEKVEFFSEVDGVLGEGVNKILCRVFSVRLELNLSVKDLMGFLSQLVNSDHIFIVEDLNIESLTDDKENIKSSFTVSAVVFLQAQKSK